MTNDYKAHGLKLGLTLDQIANLYSRGVPQVDLALASDGHAPWLPEDTTADDRREYINAGIGLGLPMAVCQLAWHLRVPADELEDVTTREGGPEATMPDGSEWLVYTDHKEARSAAWVGARDAFEDRLDDEVPEGFRDYVDLDQMAEDHIFALETGNGIAEELATYDGQEVELFKPDAYAYRTN